jgi:hypothetical protein
MQWMRYASSQQHMNDPKVALLQGTLDMLILRAISLGPRHGYGIIHRIAQMSDEMLNVAGIAVSGALPDRATWMGVRQVG